MRAVQKVRVITAGALLAFLGIVASVVYFFQPWRTCAYEDTSAGCAMLPADATGMLIVIGVAVVGVVLVVVGITSPRGRTRPPRPRCDLGPALRVDGKTAHLSADVVLARRT